MKKIKKGYILSFLLGAILFSGITGVLAYAILAKDVSYTPNNTTWKVDNVESALNDLYSKANTTITGLNSQISTLQTSNNNKQNTIDEQLKTIETLNSRLANKKEVMFDSFNATEEKTYSITTNFKPSKVIVILPDTTTGYFVIFTYDSSINNNVYECFTNNLDTYGSNTSANDGCGIVNNQNLISVNNTGFSYTSVASTLGTTYWYAIK